MDTLREPRRPHDLYRFYDADDRLLYIGISLSTIERTRTHQAEKHWWPQVAWMHVDHLGVMSRHRAEEIERHAIRSEYPAYNVTHNGALRPPTPPDRVHQPLSEVGEGVYDAVRHLMTTSSTYSPFTLESIIDAVREGVREAVVDNIDVIAARGRDE